MRNHVNIDVNKGNKISEPLTITQIQTPNSIKLPMIRNNYKSPRRIPREYLCNNYNFSKTPSPLHRKVKFFVSKEFLAQAAEKVQHVTLVKNLTEQYSKFKEVKTEDHLGNINKSYFENKSAKLGSSYIDNKNYIENEPQKEDFKGKINLVVGQGRLRKENNDFYRASRSKQVSWIGNDYFNPIEPPSAQAKPVSDLSNLNKLNLNSYFL